MKASIKKYDKYLVQSKTLPIFAVPRNAKVFESKRHIFTTADKAGSLSDNSSSEVLRFLAEIGALPLVTYILLKFFRQCQETKTCSQWGIIVPELHPYLNYRTSSISQTERSQNLFAELNPFRIFVMRQNRIARFTKYIKAFFGRISVALLLRVVAVLSQELGVRPLFMQLTDLCSTKCDRTTQAVRRIIVPLLHLYPNYRTSLTSRTERSQSVYNHSLWTILKSSPRCFVYLCMSF